MKKILLIGLIAAICLCAAWAFKDRALLRSDYELLRSDWAISNCKSWRLRLQSADEWMVIEAIIPDREHGWQHIDRLIETSGQRISGDLEYIRIGEVRYFRGDAMFNHAGSRDWVKLAPRDFPPLDGYFELRLHMTNPRTGFSFDSIDTSLWSQNHGIVMNPGGPRTYAGKTCFEWNQTWRIEDRTMHDTLCLGTSDHLPYHLTVSGGWAEVSYEWNPSISIEEPNPISARPGSLILSDPQFNNSTKYSN